MKRLAALLGIPVFAAALATLGAAHSAAPARTLHAPAISPGQLIAHRLGGSSMARMALLATPDGRDLVGHAVSCALPYGASFTVIDRDGAPYTFTGAMGLAPAWTARATTADERDRLTVCLRSFGFGTLQT